MKVSRRKLLFLSSLCCSLVLLSGCGPASKGSYQTLAPLNKDENLSSYTKLSLEMKKNDDVVMTSSDQLRIATWVAQKIKTKAPTRFAEFNPKNPDPTTLHVVVKFIQYDEGNAFARFMLAGLGQIHIDAEVLLENRAKQAQLAKYEVNKTFAWGGIYGGSTGIKDVEHGFAEAIAAIVLGEPSE